MSLKKYIFQSLLAAALLCGPVLLSATRAERLPLKLYSSAEGLATGATLNIFRDSRGFLWFSLRTGLARFDGRDFVNFRLPDQTDLAIVNSTYETRDGTFWVSGAGGTYRTHPETPIDQPDAAASAAATKSGFHIFNAQNVGQTVFSTMFEDSRGRLWGVNNDVFLIRENGELRMRQFDLGDLARSAHGNGVTSLTETRDGSIWFGTGNGVLRLLPDDRRVLYPIEKQTTYDGIGALVEDPDGRIWVAHTTGAFVFKPESIVALADAPDRSVRAPSVEEKLVGSAGAVELPDDPGKMLRLVFGGVDRDASGASKFRPTLSVGRVFKSSDGKIWIPAGGGLYVFDKRKVDYLNDTNGLPTAITSIVEDAENNIWFGSESGAVRYNRRGVSSWGLSEGLFQPRVHSIHQARDGSVYVVHGDWLISRADGAKIESRQLKMPEGDRFMWTSTTALLDSGGGWWALSTNGLYRFAPEENPAALGGRAPLETFGEKDGFRGNQFYTGFEDSGGNHWFATRETPERSGIARLDAKTKTWRFFNAADGVPEGFSARAYAEDRTGNIWLGGYGGGLLRYRDGRFKSFTPAEGLPAGGIFALYADRRNRLWIGSTREGVAMLENPNAETLDLKRFSTAQGLASDNVRALTGDFADNIYVGSISGLDRLQPDTGAVRHYSTADGLASDQISAAFSDRAGRIWLGTLNGLSRLDEEGGPNNAGNSLRVLINALRIAGKDYPVSPFGSETLENIQLKSDENNLQIQFLSIGSGLRYQYKIDGDGGKDWSAPSAERTVNFAGLAPGDYSFVVRAVDSAGRAGEQTAALSFRIAPPFWRTWQFVGALILTAAIGVFLLDRYRVAKTRQVEAALAKSLESERIARESETRFRTLAETASDAIITIDTDSRIVFVNEAVEKVFGWRAADLIGEKLTVLMPREFQARHDAGLDRYVATGAKNIPWTGMELAGRHRSGAEIPIEISFGEFELEGKRYFTGVARDISERKQAEEALRKAREERLAELEKVRTRIATDLHDDIGSSLTQISVLTEVARASAILETVKNPLERISDVSNELVDAMADIVWAINPKKDNLRELVLRMRRFASDVLAARDIEFELETPEEMNHVSLGANIRREVFSIFKETVNNIVRHSGATEVFINFAADDNYLRLEIKDNGRGFDVAEILSEDFAPDKGGNGLVNMRRRAAELGGVCGVASRPGETVINLVIPMHLTQTGDDVHITQANGRGAAIYTDSDNGGGDGLH
ncbi:MAG TPA: two-component regulator propeller domain-containing protein [Pyrinomonadaceae bacterium]|jgi:PAS domain S-box-containing protein